MSWLNYPYSIVNPDGDDDVYVFTENEITTVSIGTLKGHLSSHPCNNIQSYKTPMQEVCTSPTLNKYDVNNTKPPQ